MTRLLLDCQLFPVGAGPYTTIPTGATMFFRVLVIGAIMLPTAARADDAKPKQDKPKDPKGAAPAVIAPAEAAKKVGEKVTVEMAVASTGGRGKRVFLNSEKSFRDGKNF